jgi:4-amino-4-deoxy-L-arabinose transferase-like glycosyltransferase
MFTTTLAMWALLRVQDEDEKHRRLWAAILAASLGTGILLKSLVGIVFPLAAALIYLYVSKQPFSRRTWQRLRPLSGSLSSATTIHFLRLLLIPGLILCY